ncbi:NLR family CARD domain-containing protein 3-like isoform 2-T3 [Clarias gariepinus]
MSSSHFYDNKRLSEKKKTQVCSGAFLKRDWSKEQPDYFSMDESSSPLQSPEPGCISVKSKRSIEQPPSFKKENSSTWARSPEPSCVSMESDMSIEQPVSFQKEGSSKTYERVKVFTEECFDNFKEVERNVHALITEELKIVRNMLFPAYPACSESEVKDEDKQDSVKRAVLKITLHVLRNMELHDQANTLQSKMIPMCQKKLKSTLKRKFQCISEGLSKLGNSTLLAEIFTELYITEGDSGEINNEHEVRQIEAKAVRAGSEDTPIKCNDLFNPSPGTNKSIRTVLTKGVAGIGKTISVQKFILDWAEGKANEDIHFIFPLPFRELNLMKEKTLSLMELLCHFFPETSDLHDYESYKVLFIFDGLDETRLPLDFQNNEILQDRTEPASVDVLLTNLIKGNLLSSALLWITSRPAAAHQIPPNCVDLVAEVRGFTDPQKEEYFMKKIADPGIANRIVSHLRSTRSLYIMCHIPVFCWITATVLERMFSEAESKDIPKTLTQMFIYFLIYQSKHRAQRYNQNTEMGFQQTRDRILDLGKLAFQQLKKGNLIFYEDDLVDCGIDVKEVSVHSGMCTEIFREEFGLYLGRVYCFVHLSVQEFLAALYVFITCMSSITEQSDVVKNSALTNLLKKSVNKALQSKNGHLDLFLRFLLGISLNSNQALLRGLITPLETSHSKEETVMFIKEKIKENPSPEKSINLFHCLNELNDQSLVEEVQKYVNSKGVKCLSGVSFSPAQWSALVFVMLNSEEKLDEFNLDKYDRSEQCFLRLLPVIQASRKVVLSWCNLSLTSCKELTSVLCSNSSNVRELDLSSNDLFNAGVKILCKALENPHCKLKSLSLSCCNLTEQSCEFLASALSSNYSSLRNLNLSNNSLKDAGLKMLSTLYKITDCKLEVLKLRACHLTEESCSVLGFILKSASCRLHTLDLSNNNLQNSVIDVLSAAKINPHCRLETLRLQGCNLTEKSCLALAILLRSKLTRLDLGNNNLRDSGVKLLCEGIMKSQCKLEMLRLFQCGITDEGCAALVSALMSNPSHLRELNLDGNSVTESGLSVLFALVQDPDCSLEKLEYTHM